MKHLKEHIAVVDDDPAMCSLIQDFFEGEGYQVTSFSDPNIALEHLTSEDAQFDLIISDLKMPSMTGMELVEKLKVSLPSVPVILITAFGSIESAIEAMKIGAYDYIVKPFKLAELSIVASRAMEYRRLQKDNERLRKKTQSEWSFSGMIGKSQSMQLIFDLVKRLGHTTANVLITGESGTGKEMVARAIHDSGPRARQPFVAINCSAIPENLLESELFGHAKGSFTGANQRKVGLFEEAHGGTLFLDEIGDLSPALQAKLLRVLQEKKIRPVGDNGLKPVDVRFVSATHKNLKQAIKAGTFREDLYFRLSVIPVNIPPLRERTEDIPLLAAYFLEKFRAQNNSDVRGFSKEALKKLVSYPWEGNVRELENLIERVVVLASGEQIAAADIPDPDLMSPQEFFQSASENFPTIESIEKQYIELVLKKTQGRKDKASEILGINRRTLYRKEQLYGFSDETLSH